MIQDENDQTNNLFIDIQARVICFPQWDVLNQLENVVLGQQRVVKVNLCDFS